MKASVIVTNYNNAKYIDKCIKSLISQSYKNIEIIFVDDNSNDNSLTIVKKYKKKIKIIKKLKKIGKGSFDQMLGFYEGYKKSSGEILFFFFTFGQISFLNKFEESQVQQNDKM